ncbi:MAG: acyl-CoA dehydratase activase [Candidatus Hydrogenedentes bacterium]|nr:acyl-CoA dehydratase activase [Candidatus Hydrogenedentota bacterium]
MRSIYFLGLDIGSATAKAVLINEKRDICSWAVIPTGGRLLEAGEKVRRDALEIVGRVDEVHVEAVVSTGYGRELVRDKTRSVTEITCHAKGAHELMKDVRFVIDIGGQDSKAILLSKDGLVERFEMNDKCAAGTGRFLEVMSRVLNIPLEEIGDIAVNSGEFAKISSTCTVFAESEVISLLAQGVDIPKIVSGLCKAVSERVYGLASRVGVTPPIMLTGGVAKNRGVVYWLSKLIGSEIRIPENPQIVGAYGAALIGAESYLNLSIK